MTDLPCNTVQEYRVPPGVTQLEIQAESSGPGAQSNTTVTLKVQPEGTVRVILRCRDASGGRSPP
jgi:hypothetical protein